MKKYISLLICVCLFFTNTYVYAEKGELRAVHNGANINGNIMLEFTTGRVFRYKENLVDKMLIELMNVRELERQNDRSFYNAWVRNEDTGELIDLGPLERERDNFYTGTLRRGTDDTTGYNYLIVTLEANDGDPSIGTHVYEGEIYDTTLEEINAIHAQEQAKRQPIIDLVKKRLGDIPNKTKLKIQDKLLIVRKKTLVSGRSNQYKIEVLYLLDIIRDAVRF